MVRAVDERLHTEAEELPVRLAHVGRGAPELSCQGLIGGLDIEMSGVADGTAVVIGPFQALRELQDGQTVRVQESK